VLHHAKYYT